MGLINIQHVTFHQKQQQQQQQQHKKSNLPRLWNLHQMPNRGFFLVCFLAGRLPNANLFLRPLSLSLPFAQGEKPTLWLPSILFLWTSSRLSICHSSRHFRPQNLLQLLQDPAFKNTNPLIHSQITPECGAVAPAPALCQSAWPAGQLLLRLLLDAARCWGR